MATTSNEHQDRLMPQGAAQPYAPYSQQNSAHGCDQVAMCQQRGFFITLEGVEGAGKSTMMAEIERYYRKQGIPVVCTREPGGTPIAEQIRSILLTPNSEENITAMSELLLMYAARVQHIEHKIKPLLQAGTMVICDRFDLSTIAYQGAGRGFDLELLERLRKLALGDFAPDLTLLFDLPVEQGMERVIARGKKDRFEQESVEFFEKIRQGFLSYAEKHPQEVVRIDSSKELDKVRAEVLQILATRLPLELS